jgi:glycosyltransferase involved in cell wall biosynthesis
VKDQLRALSASGVDVTLLCTPEFEAAYKPDVPTLAFLPGKRGAAGAGRLWPKALNRAASASLLLRQFLVLRRVVGSHGFDRVLLSAYMEYLAPLWTRWLRPLKAKGVRFAAVLHDPVRDKVIGPAWWHRYSNRRAAALLDAGFLHFDPGAEAKAHYPGVALTVVPYGPHELATAPGALEGMRRELALLAGKPVALSFGFIRDNKNLDLILRALVAHPDLQLVIAGREQSSTERPIAAYKQLAAELGVAERTRWLDRRLTEPEVAALFQIADVVLVTYAASFVSKSSVLNHCHQFGKVCVVSGGNAAMLDEVRRFRLGAVVAPDAARAIEAGLHEVLARPPKPDWDGYARENSWEANARAIVRAFL